MRLGDLFLIELDPSCTLRQRALAVVIGRDLRIGWVLDLHEAERDGDGWTPGARLFGPISTYTRSIAESWTRVGRIEVTPYEPPILLARDPLYPGRWWGLHHPDDSYTHYGEELPEEYQHLEQSMIRVLHEVESRLCTGEDPYMYPGMDWSHLRPPFAG